MEWRALVRIAAVCAATATAGLAIMMPVSYGWFSSEPQKVDLMVRSVPLAMEPGAITAVIAAAAVVSIGSARAAWYTAALALTGILINHLGLSWIQIESLTTLNFVDALWAGVVLGCLAPLVWTPSLAGGAYLFGCVSSAVFGDLAQPPPDAGGPRSIERLFGGAPPVWLILVALMLLVTHLVARDRREAIPGDGPDFSLAPIVSGVVAVFVLARTSRWLAESGDRWSVVVTAVALVLLAAFLAALILPGRDGTLLLLLVGFSAAASAVVTVPRPGWADALVDVTVAGGRAAGGVAVAAPVPGGGGFDGAGGGGGAARGDRDLDGVLGGARGGGHRAHRRRQCRFGAAQAGDERGGRTGGDVRAVGGNRVAWQAVRSGRVFAALVSARAGAARTGAGLHGAGHHGGLRGGDLSAAALAAGRGACRRAGGDRAPDLMCSPTPMRWER
ncbi:hypothetical protein [Nocardia tengchongensis]|uniref:hypothetical protein n=1 Tax=Nocardia tengchongensis TaxID=2055889 RepID=UPI0036BC1306